MTSETDETEDHLPSKSQLKRESEALQKLGEELLSLRNSDLDNMDLPDELNEAVRTARKIQSRGGLKRQRQLIGKIMRQIDSELVEKQLTAIKHKHDTNTAAFRRVEQWRDRLLNNDKNALTEIINTHPDIDRQHINQLVRHALKEQAHNKPPASARKLFKYLRDIEE